MSNSLKFKCKQCYGTGERIEYFGLGKRRIIQCWMCDGTGDATVDGDEQRHIRELARIEAGQSHD